MMVFIHRTGGPDIALTGHDVASRRASPAQVSLINAVPMPVVSNYSCPRQCQSLHHHAMSLHEYTVSVGSVHRFLFALCSLQLPHCPILVSSLVSSSAVVALQ